MAFLSDDVELLRTLPSVVLATGYVDVFYAYPGLPARDGTLRQELDALSDDVRPLVTLFLLGDPVAPATIERALGTPLVTALERLRVLLRGPDGSIQTAGMCMIPFDGHLVLLPAPRHAPVALFGDDTLALAARLAPPSGGRCLAIGAGPGTFALGLARRTDHVVLLDDQSVALACAELNIVMNGLDERVSLRAGLEALEAHETFDYIAANPPPLPFPGELFESPAGDMERSASERVVRALPSLLRERGRAQLVGADLGDEHGPLTARALAEIAPRHGLSAALTITCHAPLERDSRLLVSLAQHTARAGVLSAGEAIERMVAHLDRVRCDRVHLFALTVTRGVRTPGLVVSRPDVFGGGYWTR